jgi:hypothetical protein
MILQNHMPLDQRREQARCDWRFTPHYGLPLMYLRSSPAVRSMLGAPLVTHETPVLHDPDLAVGAIQTVRALPNLQQRAAIFRASLQRSTRLCRATAHTKLLCICPICTPCLPIPTPDLGSSLFLKSSRFSVSKGPVYKRCGSMQENIDGKLNYLDQYFVGLLLGQRLTKDRAIPSAPSIRRSHN